MHERLVIPLMEATSSYITGAKAYNLFLAASAGLPVPISLVVTNQAWRLFIETTGAARTLESLGTLGEAVDHSYVRQLGKEIREELVAGVIPSAVKTELRDYLDSHLNGLPAAVRSSASAEDSREASFAGQYETLLNLTTYGEIENALKKCWLSAVSERVIEYRIKRRLLSSPFSMSALIQSMVKADVAGVLFSRNPISGDPNEIWITSNWGLGTSVVDGSTVPDRFIIERSNGKIKSRFIGRKSEREDAIDGGGVRRKTLGEDLALMPSLSESDLWEIWKMAVELEKILSAPVDVEWAIRGGDLMLLQARPITV